MRDVCMYLPPDLSPPRAVPCPSMPMTILDPTAWRSVSYSPCCRSSRPSPRGSLCSPTSCKVVVLSWRVMLRRRRRLLRRQPAQRSGLVRRLRPRRWHLHRLLRPKQRPRLLRLRLEAAASRPVLHQPEQFDHKARRTVKPRGPAVRDPLRRAPLKLRQLRPMMRSALPRPRCAHRSALRLRNHRLRRRHPPRPR